MHVFHKTDDQELYREEWAPQTYLTALLCHKIDCWLLLSNRKIASSLIFNRQLLNFFAQIFLLAHSSTEQAQSLLLFMVWQPYTTLFSVFIFELLQLCFHIYIEEIWFLDDAMTLKNTYSSLWHHWSQKTTSYMYFANNTIRDTICCRPMWGRQDKFVKIKKVNFLILWLQRKTGWMNEWLNAQRLQQ